VRKKPVRRLLVTCIAGALFLPSEGFTLGLGEIEVNSALNQNLDADVTLLSAAPDDTENLIVKLASRKEFTRAGIDRPFLLNELRFKTVVVNNVPHIRITTQSPVREPFLDFLIEIDWPKGHLVREYTVLLDPPAFMSQSNVAAAQTGTSTGTRSPSADNDAARPASSTVVAAPVSVNPTASFRPTAQQAAVASTTASPAATATTTGMPTNTQSPTSKRYRIQSGDTAWSLADRLRPDRSVSVEQMMLALLRANPDSFIKKNINGIKRGYILRIPDAADIKTISAAEARAMVKRQTALWREYRQANAGGQAVRASDNPANTATTKPSTEAQSTRTAAEAAAPHLKIVSAGTGASTGGLKDPTKMNAGELRAALALSREKLETERVEKETLQQQVDQLKGQLQKDKTAAVAVENNGLAEAQAVAQGAPATTAENNASSEQQASEPEQQAGKDQANETSVNHETPASATEPVENTTEKPVFVDETSPSAEQAAKTPATEQHSAETVANTAPTPATPSTPADPLTRFLNNPVFRAMAGGGLVLLLALVYLVTRRRRSMHQQHDEIAEDGTAASLEDVANMVEGDQLEDEAVSAQDDAQTDTDNDAPMILDTATDEVEKETGDDDNVPRDDVIAEADVYLAYGIYQQAQDLLEQAIKENPDRDDYREKLAETHYTSKNKDAFLEVATELKQRTGNEDTPAWRKVVVMGKDMCPEHALFQGSLVGGLDAAALGDKSTEPMDFDLGINAVEENPDGTEHSADTETAELTEIELQDIETTQIEDDLAAVDKSEALTDIVNEDNEENSHELDTGLQFDLSETQALTEPEPLAESAEQAVETSEQEQAEEQEEHILDEEFSLDIDASELDIDEDMVDEDSIEESVASASDEIELDLSAEDLMAETETDTETDTDENDRNDESEQVLTPEEVKISDIKPEEQLAEAERNEVNVDEKPQDDIAGQPLDETDESPAFNEINLDLSDEELEKALSDDDHPGEMVEIDEDQAIEIAETDNNDIDDNIEALETAAKAEAELLAVDEEEEEEEEEEFDLSSLDDVDEVSTKLDLARAYLDMGDQEGTKEILQEVLTDGNDEQKQEADELLNRLAS